MTKNTFADNYHNIRLMLYNEPDEHTVLFYLLGASPVQVLQCFPKEMKCKELKLVASKSQHYIYDDDIDDKELVTGLLSFFDTNKDYTIDDLTAVFDDGSTIQAHDDSETTMIFPNDDVHKQIFYRIVESQKYDAEKIFAHLCQNKNQYLSFKQPDIQINKFATFDEYLNTVK